MRPSLRRVLDAGIRIVFPEVCAECGITGAWICDDCWQQVSRIDQTSCCTHCGYPVEPANPCRRCASWPAGMPQVRSAFTFAGPVRTSIIQMKYHGQYARAVWHAEHLADVVSSARLGTFDLVVPIPLHRAKQRKRGYNQSEHLARNLASLLSIPMEQPVERIRNTPSQTTLGPRERRVNVQGAFSCTADLTGRRVLLVDDVVTTGSTIGACAEACIASHAAAVVAVTVAAGV